MYEVEERMIEQVAEDRVALFKFNLIPADVRGAHIVREFDHAARQQAEPAMRSEFVAFLEHHLQPDANADDRFACVGGLDHESVEAQLAQILHRVSESADPEQDQLIGLAQRFFVARHHGVDALRGKGFFDAAQITDAVINDGDIHYKLPFVDITPRMRSSIRVACDNALAADLNTASMM